MSLGEGMKTVCYKPLQSIQCPLHTYAPLQYNEIVTHSYGLLARIIITSPDLSVLIAAARTDL